MSPEGGWKAFPGRIRWAGWLAAALLLAVLATSAWWLARQSALERRRVASFAAQAGRLPVQGLAAPVEIMRDARGVPHIQAVRDEDAWLSLGFVHAQDRLAQMLWLRRLANGRTAEAIGPAGLAGDKLARTLGIGLLAEEQAERLEPDTRRVLEAYARGVNVRIARVREGVVTPPRALVGDITSIADWRAADSIAVLKLIAWGTSNRIETGIVLDDLIERLGSQLARPFRPTGAGVRGVEIAGDFSPADVAGHVPPTRSGESSRPSNELVRSIELQGGAAWVLGGRYTESGAPILVADLHLPATAPPLVYEAHLRGGAVDLAGATIPGMPVVWAGRNLYVSWAAIPARAVTVDLYKETVRVSDGRYQNGSRWVPLEERREVIRVRTQNGFDEVEWLVRSTRHGPLIDALLRAGAHASGPSDGASLPGGVRAEREPLAVAWTGAIPGDGIGPLLRVAESKSAAELVNALAIHHEPVVALVHVDRAGAAGVRLAGWLPQRILPTSLVPVPGRLRLFDWREPIAFDALPAVAFDASRDAPPRPHSRGYLAIADGAIGDAVQGSGIEWLWRTGETQERLDRLLRQITSPDQPVRSGRMVDGSERVDIRSAMDLLHDMGGRAARDVVPALLRISRRPGALRPEAAEIADILAEWDGVSGPGSQGAAAYHLLMRHLSTELFRAPLGEALYDRYLDLPAVRPDAVVASIVVAADRVGASGGWTDADRVASAVRLSLRRTWVSLSRRLGASRRDWRWSRLHPLSFSSFIGARRSPAPDLPDVGVGGDGSTIASSGFDPARGFAVTRASSFRMAVDLATPDRLLSSLSPGQSEHPGHPHYSDGLGRWLEGRPSLLLTSRLLVEEEAGAKLLLEPAS